MKFVALLLPLVLLFSCSSVEENPVNNVLIALDSVTTVDPDSLEVENPEGIERHWVIRHPIELGEFWNRCVVPLRSIDTAALAESIQFPLEGNWGASMGYDKSEAAISKGEFITGVSQLLDEKMLIKMKALSRNDVGEDITNEYSILTLTTSDGNPRLDADEKDLSLYFKQINKEWMLFKLEVI